MKNAGYVCLLGVVIHFEYNNNESANAIETLFNQIYT